jgi:DNA-binding MarR family transcriptional regulator
MPKGPEQLRMDDFIQHKGPAFLAHLLRRLSDELVRGASAWYPQAGVDAPPRTTSTLLALAERGPLGVTEIASLLRQSHPLVISWIRQLDAAGLIRSRADARDGRRTVIALTAKGRDEVARLREALVVMAAASQQLMDAAGPGLFEALTRMDDACRRVPFERQLQATHAMKATRKKTTRVPAKRAAPAR